MEEKLRSVIKKDGAAHLTLIDPEKQDPYDAGMIAVEAEDAGTNGIMVGGSTHATGEVLDQTVLSIKKKTDLPVILFPPGESGISKHADAIFFMSMLNSTDPYFLSEAQARGAPLVKKFGIEPIPMGYILIEPGGTVGKIGKAKLIPRKSVDLAVSYALAAQYFGMRFVYLEAGSGANAPVPIEMVEAVRKNTDVTLIVGGGIRTPEAAKERVKAGADIIVTGTIVEDAGLRTKMLCEIIEAIKSCACA